MSSTEPRNMYKCKRTFLFLRLIYEECIFLIFFCCSLTELSGESLFYKVKSIVLNHLNEIRDQVLKRFQTCPKAPNSIHSFISYFLDEYQSFVVGAENVSPLVSFLVCINDHELNRSEVLRRIDFLFQEEFYLKSAGLTWLVFNKHLYEKYVYMDKKIQQSMSTMIDLLQPLNNDLNDYSPAECANLLNRFLTFHEEMLEMAYIQKIFQNQANGTSTNMKLTDSADQKKKQKKKKISKSKEDNENKQDNRCR